MEAYYEKIDALGETLLNWADPENQYRGYTEVSFWVWRTVVDDELRRLVVP